MKKFKNKKGFGFVDSGVKILIAIVIGSLLLGGTYALAKDTVLPTVKSKVESLFDYSGEVQLSDTRIVGDINGDGVVNDADLDIMLYEAAHGYQSGYDEAVLDVNKDGTVNIKDLVRLQKIINGEV